MNRIPQKSLSFVLAVEKDKDRNDENTEIINKYIKLGVIKKFEVLDEL